MQKAIDTIKQNKIYIFPLILAFILIVLTSLKISGSSIGIYHGFLYGDTVKDSNLLLGNPQSIRSDEWLVNTQMTLAQKENGFQKINNNFSEPKDMSLLFDAPYIEWSALFKPQNFAFFALPFEHAFAFKWWFMLFLLMAAMYALCLKLIPGKIWIAIMSSIVLSFSPFVFWWYLNGTIAPLAYGILIMLIGMSIISRSKIQIFKYEIKHPFSLLTKIIALAYLLIAFALLLYPPFQIPIALVVAFFLLGWLIKESKGKTRKHILISIAPFLAALVLTGTTVGAYLLTRPEPVNAITNTVYPGERTITSGGYDVKKLLVTYLQPQLQRIERGPHYDKNQSESSSFILLPLFFTLPALGLLLWIYLKKRKIEWVLLALSVCNLLFLSQLFIQGIEQATKLFLLHLVPLERLIIGLGFLASILVVYMIKVFNENKLRFTKQITIGLIAYAVTFFFLMIWAGIETSKLYPEFISSKKLVLLLCACLFTGLALVLFNKSRIGMTILAVFSLLSVVFIHPLYRGLGPLYENEVKQSIQQISSPNDTWGAAENISIENFPQLAGRQAISGVTGYPSNEFWKKFSGMNEDTVYNRYAHTLLSSNDTNSLILVGPDFFAISGSCYRKVSREIDYIVSTSPLQGYCNKVVKTIKYPAMTFYLYELKH